MLLVCNKGGASWDLRITKLAEVVDETYQGQIFISLTNYTNFKFTLYPGQKFIQLVCVPVLYPEIEIVPESEIHLVPTQRGTGMMGSTGTN